MQTVVITGITNKMMPDGKTPYKLKQRATVKNTKDRTLEKELYKIYSKRRYGKIILVTFEVA